jgi:succinyl-CoA synthetase beta subunit
MVVRLVGTNEDKARQILSGASLVYADSLVEGAKKAIDMVRKEDK